MILTKPTVAPTHLRTSLLLQWNGSSPATSLMVLLQQTET